MLARYIFHGPVSVSVCDKSEFYRDGRTNRAGFGHGSFLRPILHCVARKLGDLRKLGYFPLELCPKLWTLKISQRQVDRVVDKSRRRSSLWITPVTVNVSLLDANSVLLVGRL